MAKQKDRHLDAPGEANRDKHINFLAEENGDVDPASENLTDKNDKDDEDEPGDDNGFFTDDDNQLQTKEEYESDKNKHPEKDEKAVPMFPSSSNPTLADRITVKADNEDILTPVIDDNSEPYIQDDDQAH